jgi:hypothetical protein
MRVLLSQPEPDRGREQPAVPAPVGESADPSWRWEGYDVAILDAFLDG